MKDTLEIFRDTLLISALVILIYILYKRLLRVAGSENARSKYPSLGNSLEWTEGGRGRIGVHLAEKMYLIVEIYDQHGNKVHTVAEGEFDAGDALFEFERKSLIPGKYYYRVTSPSQEASQYFVV